MGKSFLYWKLQKYFLPHTPYQTILSDYTIAKINKQINKYKSGIVFRQNIILKKQSSLSPALAILTASIMAYSKLFCRLCMTRFYLHWPSTDHSPEHYWKDKKHFANKIGPLNLPRVVISLSPKLWNIWGLFHVPRYSVRLNYIQGNAYFFFFNTGNYLLCRYEDKYTLQRFK